MLARAHDFLDDLAENPKYQDSVVLVATHGAMLRGLIAAFKGYEVKDFWQGGIHKNCGVTIVEIKGKEKKILKEAIVLYDK